MAMPQVLFQILFGKGEMSMIQVKSEMSYSSHPQNTV